MKDPKSFISDVPENLLRGKSDDERWLYNQQSIQRQILEHLFSNQLEGDNDRTLIRSDIKHYSEQCKRDTLLLSARIEPFEEIRTRWLKQWASKKKIASWVATALIIPILLLIAGGYAYAWFAARIK